MNTTDLLINKTAITEIHDYFFNVGLNDDLLKNRLSLLNYQSSSSSCS